MLSRSVLLSFEAESIRPRRSLSRARESRALRDFKFQISDHRLKNSDLKYEICNLQFCAKRRLLPAFVFCEVVVDGRIALEAPNDALFTPLAVENRLQKRRDLLPGNLGL